MFSKIALFLSVVTAARAACECGYKDELGRVWMESIQVPFNKIDHIDEIYVDMVPAKYTHGAGMGTLPFEMTEKNVGKNNDGSVYLKVSGNPTTIVYGAELTTRRKDILHGTFRANLQMPLVGGSCFGMFFYHNDTQEIDLEVIGQSQDMLYTSSHSELSSGEFSDVGNITFVNVPIKSFAGYHNYRFDWLRDRVDFFVDHKYVSTMYNSPVTAGTMKFQHWSNGDIGWSGELPKKDIYASIKDFDFYFNTTNALRVAKFTDQCKAGKPVCTIDTVVDEYVSILPEAAAVATGEKSGASRGVCGSYLGVMVVLSFFFI